MGCGLAVNSLGYFYFYLADRRREGGEKTEGQVRLATLREEGEVHTKCLNMTGTDRLLLVSLMTVFNFFFSGLEATFKNLSPTFAASCSLRLSRQDGAQLLAIFFGTYTLNRSGQISTSFLYYRDWGF